MKNITYTAKDGILYPDLALPEQPSTSVGKYGQLRLDYLKAHRGGTYTTLLTSGTLAAHLSGIDRRACKSARDRREPQSNRSPTLDAGNE